MELSLTAIIIIVVILYLLMSLRVLRQYERGVVFLLGKFAGERGPGLTLIFDLAGSDSVFCAVVSFCEQPLATIAKMEMAAVADRSACLMLEFIRTPL